MGLVSKLWVKFKHGKRVLYLIPPSYLHENDAEWEYINWRTHTDYHELRFKRDEIQYMHFIHKDRD